MRILAGLDTETTGLEPGDHRLVEVYAGLYTFDGRRHVEFNQRIDPQRSISIEAQRVHKISASDLVGKPTWDTVAPTLLKVLERAQGYVIHNAEFDLKFLRYEFNRVGLTMPERPVVDTMADGIWATPDGKKPTLGELCLACGVSYDAMAAHAADYDVERMMECFFKARSWTKSKNKYFRFASNDPAEILAQAA